MDKEKVIKVIDLQNQINHIDKLIEKANVKINFGNYQQFFFATNIDGHEIENRLTKNLKAQIKRVRNKSQKELDVI